MNTYLKQTPDYDISYDPNQNSLIVSTNIQFNWLNDPFTLPWTNMEKNQLAYQIKSTIWGNWTNSVNLITKGKSFFTKKNQLSPIPVVLTTQSTNNNPHWIIEVNKTQKGGTTIGSIQWSLRKILFSVEDLSPEQSKDRNSSVEVNSDSYWSSHSYEFANAYSINTLSAGNISTQLRAYYLTSLLECINDSKTSLMPKTKLIYSNE